MPLRYIFGTAILFGGLSLAANAQQPSVPDSAQPPTATASASARSGDELPERRLLAWIQALSWFAAVGTALYGIAKGREELREQRAQRDDELKWKRAQAAKALNDTMMADPQASCAMRLIDYHTGYPVTIGNAPVTLTSNDVRAALEIKVSASAAVDEQIRFIREAFDSLLYHVGVFEHYVSRELVLFDDIKHPIDYYVARMDQHGLRDHVNKYVEHYRFYRTRDFLRRLN